MILFDWKLCVTLSHDVRCVAEIRNNTDDYWKITILEILLLLHYGGKVRYFFRDAYEGMKSQMFRFVTTMSFKSFELAFLSS